MENSTLTKKRFSELYHRAENKHYNCFTEFLNLDEQNLLAEEKLSCVCFGGYENAQRVVAGFGEYVEPDDFPITLICISPTAKRFADTLGHRDFLGALMNLGIKRELLGDIVVYDNCGYLYCLSHIADFITDNLNRVKHTVVTAKITTTPPDELETPPDITALHVASLRLDAVVCAVYKLSRSQAKELFAQSKIFINSRLCQNSSANLKQGDIVSVRGMGRFIYEEQIRTTKRDRLVIAVRIYK